MKGARILFYDPQYKVCRVAERALAATGSNVDIASDEETLRKKVEDPGYDLLMLNFDAPMREDPKWGPMFDQLEKRFPRTRLVLHATAETEEYLPLLHERKYVRNLIAKNDTPLEPEELIITAEKMMRRDIFGVDKYLLWGVTPHRVQIRDSREKRQYVGEVSSYAQKLGCNERMIEMVENVVDELVTNAIYNAPRDAAGKPKYAELSRREAVTLEESEMGWLEFACDGNYIALSQVDPFGALTQNTIVNYLNRCLTKGPEQINTGAGGAGIGLYRVFQSLSKFIVNIDPGKRTEVICLVDLRLTMKRFKEQGKSFHVFSTDVGGPILAGGGQNSSLAGSRA